MTESDRDPEVSRRYRELAREEPPRALDEAILAAARRELEMRPAPLVAPTARRSWTVPVAAAAVIVLSAVVTLQIQRDQPDAELAVPPQVVPMPGKDDAPAVPRPAEAPRTEAPRETIMEQKAAAKPSKPPSDPERFVPDPKRAAPPAAAEPQSRPVAPAAKPVPRAAEAAGSTLGAAAPATVEHQESESLRDRMQPRAERDAVAKRIDESESPERTLARIVALRREGRHKEADELYAEFRRRFPEYRIPETMREQVLPR